MEHMYVIFDLETTGLYPMSDEIIEIGALKCVGSDLKVIDSFDETVCPKRRIGRFIKELTGLSSDSLSQSRTIEQVLPDFFDFCEGCTLASYNLSFDYSFLSYHGRMNGLDFSMKGYRYGVDILQIVRHYGNFTDNKLNTVAKELGIFIEGEYHRALYDTRVARKVWQQFPIATMVKRLDSVQVKTEENEESLDFV